MNRDRIIAVTGIVVSVVVAIYTDVFRDLLGVRQSVPTAPLPVVVTNLDEGSTRSALRPDGRGTTDSEIPPAKNSQAHEGSSSALVREPAGPTSDARAVALASENWQVKVRGALGSTPRFSFFPDGTVSGFKVKGRWTSAGTALTITQFDTREYVPISTPARFELQPDGSFYSDEVDVELLPPAFQ
jgi:hypothetical protein